MYWAKNAATVLVHSPICDRKCSPISVKSHTSSSLHILLTLSVPLNEKVLQLLVSAMIERRIIIVKCASLDVHFAIVCLDKQADGRVWVPRAAGRELSGLIAGGSQEDPAGGLLRQHHQCERRKERTAAAHSGGTHQNCALHEGRLHLSFNRATALLLE